MKFKFSFSSLCGLFNNIDALKKMNKVFDGTLQFVIVLMYAIIHLGLCQHNQLKDDYSTTIFTVAVSF